MSRAVSIIIPVAPAHAPLLAGMHRICFTEHWDEAAMAAVLAMPGSFGLLADGNPPQGFILCRIAVDEAEVLTLLVLPPFRRRGIAAALLGAALAAARAAGVSAMYLEVAANNAAGLALYSALGFQQVGRRPRYYGGSTDALVLKADL